MWLDERRRHVVQLGSCMFAWERVHVGWYVLVKILLYLMMPAVCPQCCKISWCGGLAGACGINAVGLYQILCSFILDDMCDVTKED